MRYNAFLSYSHAEDILLAGSIQRALHRFARPWYRVYALRVFRDKTSLSANPALWNAIVRALSSSEYLLLLGSPLSKASPWVGREIEWFLTNRTSDKILVVLTRGEIVWDSRAGDFDWARTTSLPECLRGRFQEEPLWVDFTWARKGEKLSLRHPQFRAAILDLAAPLHGKLKDDLDSEDLQQHRKALRLAWSAVLLLCVLAVSLGVAAFYATLQRDEAARQGQIAERRRQETEEQRQVAEDRRQVALSRQLAAQALTELPNHLDLALLQSVEAVRVRATREARSALLASLFYSPHLRRFIRGDPGVLTNAAFSGDGRLLLALSEDSGEVSIRGAPAEAGHAIVRLQARGDIKSAALSRNGRLYAVGVPGKVEVRTVNTNTIVAELRLPETRSAPAVLAFSTDGTKLAAYESSAGLLIWNLEKRSLETPALQPRRWVTALAFSPDNRMIASGGHDKSILLHDVSTGQQLGPPLQGHKSKIFSLAFSPDGSRLASGSEDRTIIFWDPKTGRALGPPLGGHEPWALGYESWGLSVAFSPDGRLLASAGKDGNVILWGVAGRERLGSTLRGHSSGVINVAFSKDGGSLVSVDETNTVLEWATDASAAAAAVLEGHGDGVDELAFSDGNGSLSAVSLDRREQLEWDLATRKSHARAVASTGGKETRVAVSPDRRWRASSDGSNLILTEVAGKSSWRLPVATASASHMVTSLALSPDARLLASGGFDGTLAFWDVQTRRLVRPAVKAHREAVQALAFSPDGGMVASAGVGTADFDPSVRLWDAETGKQSLPPLAGHNGPVRALAFSPDGKLLASADLDRVVLWDMSNRERIGQPLEGQAGPILALAFSPDGNWLASGGYDDRVLLWDLRLETWLRRACGTANRYLDKAEWARLVGDAPYAPACR